MVATNKGELTVFSSLSMEPLTNLTGNSVINFRFELLPNDRIDFISGRQITQWDMKLAKPTMVYAESDKDMWTISYSPNKQLCALPYGESNIQRHNDNPTPVRIFDTKTGKKITELKGHIGAVYGMQFFRDNTRILTGSTDGTIRI